MLQTEEEIKRLEAELQQEEEADQLKASFAKSLPVNPPVTISCCCCCCCC